MRLLWLLHCNWVGRKTRGSPYYMLCLLLSIIPTCTLWSLQKPPPGAVKVMPTALVAKKEEKPVPEPRRPAENGEFVWVVWNPAVLAWHSWHYLPRVERQNIYTVKHPLHCIIFRMPSRQHASSAAMHQKTDLYYFSWWHFSAYI